MLGGGGGGGGEGRHSLFRGQGGKLKVTPNLQSSYVVIHKHCLRKELKNGSCLILIQGASLNTVRSLARRVNG